MNGHPLTSVGYYKDLGVNFHQSSEVVLKANHMLVCVKELLLT